MATQRKKSKLKEPVKVRTKKLADGSESYYLDIYIDGKRTYEFLKLYHLPEINNKIKEQNRATREAVETIKSQRIIELTKNKAGLKLGRHLPSEMGRPNKGRRTVASIGGDAQDQATDIPAAVATSSQVVARKRRCHRQ